MSNALMPSPQDPRSGDWAPAEVEVRSAYRRVLINAAGETWPLRGTVLGWWTRSDGLEMCRLRTFGSNASEWVVFDPDRIVLLVESGT
ncbi:hypothetical protein [Streptomyces sp. NPDC046821]|uniref:hypothetical protein n=1 Tax=Streptomyces sp. NPDC046821 TaxID=3154702 RepID=UPI0033FF99DF